MSVVQKQYHEALQLQRRRCEVYHSWREHLNEAFTGNQGAGDLDGFIRSVVLKEFQEVSTGLRQLQTTVAESIKTSPADRIADDPRPFLVRWVDSIQAVEKEHFEVSVQLACALASHCAPNVVPLYVRERAAEAAAAARAEQKALAKKATQEKERQQARAQAAAASSCGCAAEATTHATATSASQSEGAAPVTTSVSAPLQPSMSLHDDVLCPLVHALPIHQRGALFFVHSSGAVDLLGDDSEQEAEEREEREADGSGAEDQHDDEDEGEDKEIIIKARSGEVALTDRQDRVLAYYAPHDVAVRCVKAERACVTLRRRNHELELAATDLCEELQCELSDL